MVRFNCLHGNAVFTLSIRRFTLSDLFTSSNFSCFAHCLFPAPNCARRLCPSVSRHLFVATCANRAPIGLCFFLVVLRLQSCIVSRMYVSHYIFKSPARVCFIVQITVSCVHPYGCKLASEGFHYLVSEESNIIYSIYCNFLLISPSILRYMLLVHYLRCFYNLIISIAFSHHDSLVYFLDVLAGIPFEVFIMLVFKNLLYYQQCFAQFVPPLILFSVADH